MNNVNYGYSVTELGVSFQPDSSVVPVFDQFVMNGITEDKFSMQLCSSSELDPSAEPTVAGTMVRFHFLTFMYCI